jgi:hypothetical protein
MAGCDADALAILLRAISSSEVIELNAVNLDTVVNPWSLALVVFYNPAQDWRIAGPNQSLEEASKVLAYSGVNLGRVDASRQIELCAKFNLRRFP